MKRYLSLVLAILLSLLPLGALGENLLANGGFESVDTAGQPEGWYQTAYRSQAGYSRMGVSTQQVHSGQYSAVIENASSNDARLVCTVPVEPETLYKLSGYVLVERMEDLGNGANFAIEDIYACSAGLFDTEGQWTYLEWYGETGQGQTELTFGIRVGGYSAESIGKAYFDDICLEKLETLPQGIVADLWYNDVPFSNADEQTTASERAGSQSAVLFLALAIVFGFLCCVGYPYAQRLNKSQSFALLCVVMALAAGLRVYLGYTVPGYEVDMNCFTAWSLRMASKGPAGFYEADYFCDYPPGFLLLIWPVGLWLNTIGWQSAAATLVIKTLPIVCDLAGALVLWRFAQKRVKPGTAVFLAAVYALNPAVLVNGAAWGQVDSVLALMIMLVTLLALNQNWRAAMPLFIAAALIKPQALLFAPVGLAWLVLCLLHASEGRKKQWKEAGMGALLALAVALAIVLPFSLRQDSLFGWLIELYRDTLSSYPYATLNTASLYYLAGANWHGLEETVPGWLTLTACMLFTCMGGCLLWKRKDKKAKLTALLCLLMSAAQLAFFLAGASYAVFGYGMMAFAFAFAVIILCFDNRAGSLPFAMALALMGVYVLGVKVHERYLFCALLLLLVSYALCQDRRVLALCVGFSLTTFLNTAIVLNNSILYGSAQGHLNLDTLALNDTLCIANLLLLGLGLWTGLTGRKETAMRPQPCRKRGEEDDQRARRMLFAPRDARLHLGWKDYAIMGAATLLYGMLAFTHLGSTKAPQTAWVSSSPQEQVVLDLGSSQAFEVLYYAGVSYNSFSIAVSQDGESWSENYPCEMREGLCYRWLYAVESSMDNGQTTFSSIPLQLNGRYLRLNALSAGLNLWEIVARDAQGNPLSMTVVSHTGANPDVLDEPLPVENLIDEADTCTGEPGWYNGTYFDEIYHARTAYEHLHGQKPYETTHPPLGKLLMAVGIAIFGMTPFGWRFVGTFFGVLMLPALYLLAKQLTHKRGIASLSMLAFALDLMHYTQTRIATIDSFPVFFILLSYLFMVRYMQTDVFAAEESPKLLSKSYLCTLLPLLLSGVCMGLSIASKWIGIYSAVGLALLFFLTLHRQWRVSYLASGLSEQDCQSAAARCRVARQLTMKRMLVTCLFCVGFFVLIPCVIYYLCYIPYLSPTGPVTLSRVIDAQIGMLHYHSTPGLGMDHPFQSPWWQWPFILKPMWFAQDKYEPADYASTIMCMGNPWVYVLGALAMLVVLGVFIARLFKRRFALSIDVDDQDEGMTVLVISIGFLAQYLPWVLVPRSMYMYHYFASVPFIILATMVCLRWLGKTHPAVRYALLGVWIVAIEALCVSQFAWPLWPMLLADGLYALAVVWDRKTARKPLATYGLPVGYVLFAAAFFVMFFPYASGWLTSTEWLDAMKWFSKLYY